MARAASQREKGPAWGGPRAQQPRHLPWAVARTHTSMARVRMTTTVVVVVVTVAMAALSVVAVGGDARAQAARAVALPALAPALEARVLDAPPSPRARRATTPINLDRQAVTDLFLAEYSGTSNGFFQFVGDIATCQPGTNAAAHQDNVLRRVNFFRAMVRRPPLGCICLWPVLTPGFALALHQAELPPVSLNTDKSRKALQSSLALSANEILTHNLTSLPNCVSADALEGAASSNIAAGIVGVVSGYTPHTCASPPCFSVATPARPLNCFASVAGRGVWVHGRFRHRVGPDRGVSVSRPCPLLAFHPASLSAWRGRVAMRMWVIGGGCFTPLWRQLATGTLATTFPRGYATASSSSAGSPRGQAERCPLWHGRRPDLCRLPSCHRRSGGR